MATQQGTVLMVEDDVRMRQIILLCIAFSNGMLVMIKMTPIGSPSVLTGCEFC